MNNQKKVTEDDKIRTDGFKRGLEADKILGSADDNGELMYLMQWWVKTSLRTIFISLIIYYNNLEKLL